jgi:branched-chain amino acid transport system substrate-binding protein
MRIWKPVKHVGNSAFHAPHSALRVVGAVVLVLPLLGCGRGGPVVKVGFVAPLTGDQAPHGEDMLNGAMLAVEHAEREGPVIPGRRLVLYSLDDQRSPTQAVAAAKKLAADPDVVAVVGHLNSSCTMPASAVYHEARLLQITPVSSNPKISRQGFDTFYRTCATDDLQGPGAAAFAVREQGASRIFILDDRTTYGHGLAEEFKRKAQALGAEVIGHEGIAQGDKDFVPVLTKVKAAGPDLLYFAGMFPEGALLIKQRMAVGLSAKFMGGDGLFDPVLINLATPQAAEGIHLTTIGSDIRQIPTAQAFVREYEERFGPIGAYSAYSYEATSIAIRAVRTAGKADRAAVLAAMKALKDYPGLFGPQNFDERGDTRIRDIGIFTVKDGAFTFVKSATWD